MPTNRPAICSSGRVGLLLLKRSCGLTLQDRHSELHKCKPLVLTELTLAILTIQEINTVIPVVVIVQTCCDGQILKVTPISPTPWLFTLWRSPLLSVQGMCLASNQWDIAKVMGCVCLHVRDCVKIAVPIFARMSVACSLAVFV